MRTIPDILLSVTQLTSTYLRRYLGLIFWTLALGSAHSSVNICHVSSSSSSYLEDCYRKLNMKMIICGTLYFPITCTLHY